MGGIVSNCVNIACGNIYVPGWQNLDFSPVSVEVTRADLTGRLPLPDGQADLVYSSHFLEHVPVERVPSFLAECHRLLKPGAVIRLVMPDLEDICREYLAMRSIGEHEKADFLVIELLDQCVRKQPGGQLASVLQESGRTGLQSYILSRLGNYVDSPRSAPLSIKRICRALLGRFESLYLRALLALLPSVFRQQNVSRAVVGETHAWVYDFHTVSRLLAAAGFVDILRVEADTSRYAGFPFAPLDLDNEGRPRKGVGSLFIEAAKPCS